MRSLALAIFLVFFVGSSASAAAQLSPKGRPDFDKYQQAWDEAAEMSKADLRGVWLSTAVAVNPECKRMGKSQADPRGLRNPDGSNAFALQFMFWPYENTDMYVGVYHLGAYYLNQGPYKMSTEEPHFSTYGYVRNTNQMVLDSRFEWSCRETAPGIQMLCSIRFVYDRETKDPICTIQDSAIFLLYSRYSY